MAAIVQDLSRLEKAVDILDAIYRHRKQNPTQRVMKHIMSLCLTITGAFCWLSQMADLLPAMD